MKIILLEPRSFDKFLNSTDAKSASISIINVTGVPEQVTQFFMKALATVSAMILVIRITIGNLVNFSLHVNR